MFILHYLAINVQQSCKKMYRFCVQRVTRNNITCFFCLTYVIFANYSRRSKKKLSLALFEDFEDVHALTIHVQLCISGST